MSTMATLRTEVRPRAWRDLHLPLLSQIAKAFIEWRAMRRAERELHALDDRTLKDIGLARSEIRGAVRALRGAAHSQP